jgi:GNAT superfamily N-acetyltransferase
MSSLLLDTAALSRFDATVCAYTLGRMRVAARALGDESQVRCVEWENVRALLAPGNPNPAFNTLMVSGPASIAHVEEALDAYRDAGVTPRAQLVPGALSEELSALLSSRGLRQTVLQPVFVRRGEASISDLGGLVRVVRVETPASLEAFQLLYVRGWQVDAGFAPTLASFIRGWVKLPGWSLYLALERGEPIGVATLFDYEGLSYLADAATPPEFRGRGAQTALLGARLEAARERGAEVVFGMADFGSPSHRNLEQAGVPMRYARSIWTMAT